MSYKSKIFAGVIFYLISFSQYFLRKDQSNFFPILILWFMFGLGIIFTCEGIMQYYKRPSLVNIIFKDPGNFLRFTLASIAGGILLEGLAQWLGKLWIYPYLNNSNYALIFIPMFFFYWLMIAESYLMFKAFIKHSLISSFKREKIPGALFKVVGISGAIILVVSIIFGLYNYTGNYEFSIGKISDSSISFILVMLFFLGSWLVFEYLEARKVKTSLLIELVNHHYRSLLIIILSAFFTAILLEIENLPMLYWKYTNWPYEDTKLFNLPILIFLTWPLHYISFLSLLNILLPDYRKEIWREN